VAKVPPRIGPPSLPKTEQQMPNYNSAYGAAKKLIAVPRCSVVSLVGLKDPTF